MFSAGSSTVPEKRMISLGNDSSRMNTLVETTKNTTTRKFTSLQLTIVDSTELATELLLPPQTAKAFEKQQLQQQQRQPTTTKRRQKIPKNVIKGFHSRDPVDICAQILEVIARQNLMVVDQVRRNAFRQGVRKSFRINRDGVVSVNHLRRIVFLSEHVLYPYVGRMIRLGLMETQSLVVKRDKVHKIPVITDKGRHFLQVYREIKGLLSVLFVTTE